ncbi:MAG: hypothetical protein H6591_03560 [Flavobacteriales bacterium]|nr:hypothetical protein [Flavobacteriales bacterium]
MKQNLKSYLLLSLALLAFNRVCAQEKKAWSELSAFHTVMSQTFHPAEEGDLKPIRERSGELVEKAVAWQNSPIPTEYADVKGIEKSLAALVEGSKALDEAIKAGAKDEAIIRDLSALHDVFHTIVGLCRPGH